MWTENARSWRKNKKRAVSPIIATILLVAITVVLAAVLYILISGLTKGPGNTPLGTAFGWGPGANVTAATAATGCAAASKECYSLEIASAGGGIAANQISFTARTPSGAALAMTNGATGWTMTLVSVAGAAITATWTASGNCVGAGCSTPLASGQTLVMYCGGATASLSGDVILAVGQGSYQGTVATQGLPP
jgi:flagellin-like protein